MQQTLPYELIDMVLSSLNSNMCNINLAIKLYRTWVVKKHLEEYDVCEYSLIPVFGTEVRYMFQPLYHSIINSNLNTIKFLYRIRYEMDTDALYDGSNMFTSDILDLTRKYRNSKIINYVNSITLESS